MPSNSTETTASRPAVGITVLRFANGDRATILPSWVPQTESVPMRVE